MFFLGNSFTTISMSLLSLIAALICFRKHWRLSVALLLSLFSARYFNNQDYHSIVMILCAVICLIDINGKESLTLKQEGNEINYALCYLYCLRVIVDIPKIAGITGLEASWFISMLLLGFQLFLAFGAGVGHGKGLNTYLSKCRSNFNAFIFQR